MIMLFIVYGRGEVETFCSKGNEIDFTKWIGVVILVLLNRKYSSSTNIHNPILSQTTADQIAFSP